MYENYSPIFKYPIKDEINKERLLKAFNHGLYENNGAYPLEFLFLYCNKVIKFLFVEDKSNNGIKRPVYRGKELS